MIKSEISFPNLKAQEASKSGKHGHRMLGHEKAESREATADDGGGGPDEEHWQVGGGFLFLTWWWL